MPQTINGKYPIHCTECSPSRINGFFCHEEGCPNDKKTFDHDTGEWHSTYKCFICGYDQKEGEICCIDE